MNDWSNRKDAALATIASAAAAKISQNPGLGVPTALQEELANAGTYLNSLIISAKEKRDAAVSATVLKDVGRGEAVDALTAVGQVLYANPDVSDYQLQNLGFSPRPSGPSPQRLPTTVAGVKVSFSDVGAPVVSFLRAGNRTSTIFVIQTSPDAGVTWDSETSTLRTRKAMPGLQPGAQVRVVATNSLGEAPPSSPVTVGSALAPSAGLRVVKGGKAA